MPSVGFARNILGMDQFHAAKKRTYKAYKRRQDSMFATFALGPLHMSPVTGLARLPGRILLSVQMGNFSPVDRDEIQGTKPTW